MHWGNAKFWEQCAEKYPRYFSGPNRILEVGSYNVNGTVRRFFSGYQQYVGVDWRPGPCVDVVCMARDMQFEEPFDVVISASMLEHDPTWKESITKMVECLRPDGILLLSWGGAQNSPHELYTAPDGNFHALRAGYVLDLLSSLGVYVHEFMYETNTPFMKKMSLTLHKGSGSQGSVVLVAFKEEYYAVGDSIIDELLPEDRSDG